DQLKRSKIDPVGAERPGAVPEVRIKNLHKARETQPPVEPPSSTRADPRPMPRKVRSMWGISSRVTASPYGPWLAELTWYGSPSGPAPSSPTRIIRGVSSAIQRSWNADPAVILAPTPVNRAP